MAQFKKPEVREAILASAHRHFASRGYHNTTLQQVAAGAGVSAANVYVYFESKLDILYALYDPWMRARLARLENELAAIRNPLERLRTLLGALWRDIPAEENGFANNIMQALSTASAREGYKPTLIRWIERRLSRMLHDALPPRRRHHVDAKAVSHLLVMALDGFVIYRHLNPKRGCDDATIDQFCRLLLGNST